MRYGFLSSILAAADLCLAASVPPRAARTDCKKFEFDLTWETRAPDGFSRPLILINGKSPGPEIHIKEGDCVEVRNIEFPNMTAGTDVLLTVGVSKQQNAIGSHDPFSRHPVSRLLQV